MKKLVILTCENDHVQKGRRIRLVTGMCIGQDYYDYPPGEFILAMVDKAREDNTTSIMVRLGFCWRCDQTEFPHLIRWRWT